MLFSQKSYAKKDGDNMAIFHLSVKIISKSSGRSAIAAAAYRAGERLENEENRKIHDFTNKKGVVYSEIQLSENAPKEYKDRQKLWNSVQEMEKRADAQVAREVEVAIPKELERENQIKLVRDYIQEQFIKKGMIADWSIHDKGDGNPHAHIMLTMRSLKKNGEWAPKQKSTYLLDENGEKIPQIDAKTGKQKIGARGRKMWKRTTVAYNNWNNKENVELWRKEWANKCNQYLSQEQRINHKSYKRQGISLIPTIHEGYTARKIENNGGTADRTAINRQIKQTNQEITATMQIIDAFRNLRIQIELEKRLKELKNKMLKAITKIIKTHKQNLNRLEGRLNERIREQSSKLVQEREEFERTEKTEASPIREREYEITTTNTSSTEADIELEISEREIERRKLELAREGKKSAERRRVQKGLGNDERSKEQRRSNQRIYGFNQSKGRSR